MRVVALLRGINVGGRNKVGMAELRDGLTDLGFAQPKTLLQSGNVVLECPPARLPSLAADLEGLLADRFGVRSRVVVRDPEELAEAIRADPFLASVTDPARHLVGFASAVPDAEPGDALNRRDYGPDLIRVVGSHVYMWCPAGFSASPFFKMDLDRLLGVSVTARNWRTVTSLADMAGVTAT